MKPLSLEEISTVQEYETWSDFDMNDNFERLLHTAREYHRLKEALEFYASQVQRTDEEDWYAECPLGWRARKALKESEGE